MFLPHKCIVYSISTTKVNGASKESKTEVYTEIPCMFYRSKKQSLSDTGLSRNTDMSVYEVILDHTRTSINEGDIIELIDENMGSLGEYRIQAFDANYSKLKGRLDNIHFTCVKI